MALARHVPALREPVLKVFSFLDRRSAAVLLDATCGTGGHTDSFCERFPHARMVGIDADKDAVNEAQKRLVSYSQRVDIRHMSFSRVSTLPERFDAVLADVGIGSHSMVDRGFSYKTDGPLDMRFNAEGDAGETVHDSLANGTDVVEDDLASTAADSRDAVSRPRTAGHILTRWPAWRLRAVFETYGDLEPELASALASAIVCWRHDRQMKSSLELRHVIELACTCIQQGQEEAAASAEVQTLLQRIQRRGFSKAALWVDKKSVDKTLSRLVGSKPSFPREVRAVFQALRIVVNDELAHLAGFLKALPLIVKPEGAFAIITYQPHESDLVVAACRALLQHQGSSRLGSGSGARWVMHPASPLDQPMRPTFQEVKENRRARSARLYVLQRQPCSDGSSSSAADEQLQCLAESARVGSAAMSVLPRLPNRAEQMTPVRPLVRFTHKPAEDMIDDKKHVFNKAPSGADKRTSRPTEMGSRQGGKKTSGGDELAATKTGL